MFIFLYALTFKLFVAERVGAHVVECACVVELVELKVHTLTDSTMLISTFSYS